MKNMDADLPELPFFWLFACYHRTEISTSESCRRGWISLCFFGDCLGKSASHAVQERIAAPLSRLARLLVEINKQSLVTACFQPPNRSL